MRIFQGKGSRMFGLALRPEPRPTARNLPTCLRRSRRRSRGKTGFDWQGQRFVDGRARQAQYPPCACSVSSASRSTTRSSRWLVSALYRDAHAPAVSAALRIDRGIDHDLYAVALSPDERTAILGVLDDPPAGLAELRNVLMREHGGSPPICEDSPLW